MTYVTIKELIGFELSADRVLPDNLMATFVHNAMKEVAMVCVPLTLVQTGMVSGTVLRTIDDVNHIRTPSAPGADDAMIDIDDSLSMAVVYCVCKNVSRDNKAGYIQMMNRAINDHEWAVYEAYSCNDHLAADASCDTGLPMIGTELDGIGRYDITMNQGADYTLSLQITDDLTAQPLDLTGATIVWTMMLDDYSTVLLRLDGSVNPYGTVTVTEPLAGRVTLTVDKSFTATLSATSFDTPYALNHPYAHQLDVNDTRYMVGRISVIAGV